MATKRRKHSDEFKAKVALEAVKGVHTLSELSSTFKVHPTVIAGWKRKLVGGAAAIFGDGHADDTRIAQSTGLQIAIGGYIRGLGASLLSGRKRAASGIASAFSTCRNCLSGGT